MMRVELMTPSLPRKCSTTELHRRSECWSGRRGSNPPPEAWKASALPNELLPRSVMCDEGLGVGRGGFEPPKAAPTDLQSAPFDRSGISPFVRGIKFYARTLCVPCT